MYRTRKPKIFVLRVPLVIGAKIDSKEDRREARREVPKLSGGYVSFYSEGLAF